MQIFVSLAAYCEPHLAFTLDGLFAKAEHPERLRVGLIDQSHEDNLLWLKQRPWFAQVAYRKFDPVVSEGVCWARHQAMQLYRGERHFLQVDAHTFFFPGWDSALINLHRQLQARFPKPLISAYPPAFEFDAEGDPAITHPLQSQVSTLVPENGERLRRDCATLRFRGDWLDGADFALGYHLAAGFIFAGGDFVREVPYDPLLYFHGEEQNLALRAWTRGWDIAHPRQDFIPLLHLYKSAGQAHASQHWNAQDDARRQLRWQMLAARSDARLLALVRGEIAGDYGLGNVRSLHDYIHFSGLDYTLCQP